MSSSLNPAPVWFKFSIVLGIAVPVSIIALHAALLPESFWQGDEFFDGAFAREGHLRYLWQARINSWSPRPFSELPFYFYSRLTASLMRPLTVPFLSVFWLMLFAAPLVTLRRQGDPVLRILVGLTTGCVMLLGHPDGEMFYWPAGAVAYLSTLAASIVAFFLVADGRAGWLGGAVALCGCLTVCAASSEAGAVVAVPLSLAAAGMSLRRCAVFLLPLLMSGFVFSTLIHHRMVSTEAFARPFMLGHFVQSLRPVPGALLHDIVAIWFAKILFVFGLRWCWSLIGPAGRPHAALLWFAGAFLVGAAGTVAASVFQFGAVCCQRHDTLRQGWVFLAIAALAIYSTRRPAAAWLARFGPAMLACACLVGVAPVLPGVIGDFRKMPAIVAVSRHNWRSGLDKSQAGMVFQLPPATEIVGSVNIPPGSYVQPADKAWYAHGIMKFFGKERLEVRAEP